MSLHPIENVKICQKIFQEVQEQPGVQYDSETNDITQRRKEIILQNTQHLDFEKQQRFNNEFFSIGPLEKLLENNHISEIIINDWNQVWIEVDGQLSESPDHFLSPETYLQIFHKVCEMCHININLETPHSCKEWGNFRVTALTEPISASPSLIFRRHGKLNLNLNQLTSAKMISPEQYKTITEAVLKRKSILIIGGTGSGKTTLLNACLNSIPKNERVIVLEDTRELECPNSASTCLSTRPGLAECYNEISLTELLKLSLRMRPDRLVVGEVRGAEAKDLLLSISSGHSGSFCSLHANSAKQALIRLEMLIQLGAPQWSLDAIRQLIYLSIDYIILTERSSGAGRQVKEITRIAGIESFGLLLESTNF